MGDEFSPYPEIRNMNRPDEFRIISFRTRCFSSASL